MYRIILFLVLIALAGLGAAWVADQPGDVVMTWGGWRASPSVPTFVLLFGIAVVAALRETSILFATLIAGFVLRESIGPLRVISACIIAGGAAILRLA